MIVLLMGTTGAGKTTVGQLLAERLQWIFLDADSFHSAANIEKMKHGIPLTDKDRMPWLATMHAELVRRKAAGEDVVLACSALKQKYRDEIGAGLEMKIAYLKGTYEEMREHILARHGHFAGESILSGQFADLEEPKNAIVLDVSRTPQEIVSELLRRIRPS